MNLSTIILIGVSLSMDSFAVSISSGIALKKLVAKDALKIALYLGAFQGTAPIIGWLVGKSFESEIKIFDHWIALILLSSIGIKMIWESQNHPNKNLNNVLTSKTLIALGIATSLDATAVGINFAFTETPILEIAIIIGTITAFFSSVGVYIGHKSGHIFEKKMEVLGGVILILIGFKIFISQ